MEPYRSVTVAALSGMLNGADLCLSVVGQSGGPRAVTVLRRMPHLLVLPVSVSSAASFLQVIDWITGQFFRLTVGLSISFSSQTYLMTTLDFCVGCPLGSVSVYSFPSSQLLCFKKSVQQSSGLSHHSPLLLSLVFVGTSLALQVQSCLTRLPVTYPGSAQGEAQDGPDQLVLSPSRERQLSLGDTIREISKLYSCTQKM